MCAVHKTSAGTTDCQPPDTNQEHEGEIGEVGSLFWACQLSHTAPHKFIGANPEMASEINKLDKVEASLATKNLVDKCVIFTHSQRHLPLAEALSGELFTNCGTQFRVLNSLKQFGTSRPRVGSFGI